MGVAVAARLREHTPRRVEMGPRDRPLDDGWGEQGPVSAHLPHGSDPGL